MLIYSYIITFLLICTLLTGLIFVALIVNYGVIEDESIFDLLTYTKNRKSKWLIIFGMTCFSLLMLLIINNAIFKSKIIREYSKAIDNFDFDSDKLIINDSLISNPKIILNKIDLKNSVMVNHSSNINRIKVEIVKKESVYSLIFGRDSNDSLNYHIFDERFPYTNENEIKMIRTEAFNGF